MCADSDRDTLGSAASPIEIPLASLPFEEQVDWRGLAFLRVTGLTAGQRYAVELRGSNGTTLLTFDGVSDYSAASCRQLLGFGPSPALCTVEPSGTSIDVAIDVASYTTPIELNVGPIAQREGTDVAPVQLDPGDLPYVGAANGQAPSWYEITGLTMGQPYLVTITSSTGPLNATFHQAPGLGNRSFQRTNASVVRGFGTPTATSLFVSVLGLQANTIFEIAVAPNANVSEGTKPAPVSIASDTGLPYEGTVGSALPSPFPNVFMPNQSFYAITGLTPGTHLVELTAPPNVGLMAFGDDATFNSITGTCFATAGADSHAECSIRITGTTLHVSVANPEAGTPFTLELSEPPFMGEGSEAAPIALTSGGLPYDGQFEGSVSSYYELTGLTPGEPYLVRVSDANAITRVNVFDDGSELCVIMRLAGETACVVTPTGTTLDFAVGGQQALTSTRMVGGEFTLDVEPYVFDGVGTADEPFEIACTETTLETQAPALGSSYYEVTGVTPGVPYLIEVDGFDHNGSLVAVPSEDPSRFEAAPCAPIYEDYETRCAVISSTDHIYVRVTSDGPDTFELTVRAAASGSEGTEATPVEVELPFSGVVASRAPSYYEVAGLTLDESYVARVSGGQEGVTVSVCSRADCSTDVAGMFVPTATAVDIPFFAYAETMYIVLRIDPALDGSTSFDLDVEAAPVDP